MSAARWLAALAWPAGVALAWLPPRALMVLGAVLGGLWFYAIPVRRAWTLAHLAAALPGLDARARRALARQVFVEQARNVLELVAWRRLERELRRGERARVRVEGGEHLRAALARGRGVLVLTAHLGNFDLAACHQALTTGLTVHVVSKRLSWRALDALWRSTRARFGVRALSGESTIPDALQVLRGGGVVAMVLDQHSPERRAVESPFLGLEARTSPALATLALRSQATVLPCFAQRDARGRHRVVFEAALALPEGGALRERVECVTRECLARVERAVRADPSGWLWLHRRWKDASGRPRVLRDGATSGGESRRGRPEAGPTGMHEER